MDAWGPGTFDNDAAGDWAGDLLDSDDEVPICDVLDAITDEPPELLPDAEICCAALAAAELVAATAGHPAADLPAPLAQWARDARGGLDDELTIQALTVVARVRDASELAERRRQDAAWLTAVRDLEDRLRRPG